MPEIWSCWSKDGRWYVAYLSEDENNRLAAIVDDDERRKAAETAWKYVPLGDLIPKGYQQP